MKAILPATIAAALLAGCAAPQPIVRRAEPVPIAGAPATQPLWPAGAPGIVADSAIMIDARTGEVLYQKNADKRRPVASTQKLLTALIVSRSGDLTAPVTVASSDTRVEPTKLGIRPGERYTRRSLLEAIMVKSCNDACAALARDHSGSETAFASTMNGAAWSLGARDSHFVNSNGLPAPQYSTARDMSRIAFAAYRDPLLRQFMREQAVAFRHANGRVTLLQATNKLLARSPSFNGMKTGYTDAAGRCLIASGQLNGREVIFVQLGSKTKNIFDDAQKLMAWSPRRSAATGSTTYGTF